MMEANYDEAVIKKVVTETLGQVARQAQSPKMTLALAVALIEAVEQKAAKMGVAAVVAVSDDKGRPVAVHCMDDAFVASFDIALNKTFTSAGL